MVVVLGGILLLSIQRTTKTGKSAGMVWGLGAMAGLGVSLAVLDRVTEAGGAMLAVFGARALSVIPVYAFMRSRGVGIQLPRGRGGWGLLVAAALLDAGGFVGFNLGVDVAPVAVVAPIVAAHPVVTTGLGRGDAAGASAVVAVGGRCGHRGGCGGPECVCRGVRRE